MALEFDARGYRPIDDCVSWFETCRDALAREHQVIRQAAGTGAQVPERYLNLTVDELDDLIQHDQEELVLATIVTIVASTEARLRVDAARRKNIAGDHVGVRLTRLIASAREEWMVPYRDEGLLDAWRDGLRDLRGTESEINAIGHFKPLINIRHWIAHGRYFSVSQFNAHGKVQSAYDRAEKMCDAINMVLARNSLSVLR